MKQRGMAQRGVNALALNKSSLFSWAGHGGHQFLV